MIVSECCKTKIRNGFCTKCGNATAEMILCHECLGEGKVDVIDYNRVHGRTITPPYKTVICDNCNGEGYVYVDPEDLEDLEEEEE